MFEKLLGKRATPLFALRFAGRGESLAFFVADPVSGVVRSWLDIAAYDLQPDHQAGRLVLDQWLAEGRGELVGNEFVVDVNSLYLADDADLRALPFPPLAQVMIKLSAKGGLQDPGFAIERSFRDLGDRPKAGVRRVACFLDDGAEALLSAAEYDLLRALDGFEKRGRADRTPEAQLLAFTKIKSLARAAGATLDAYLSSSLLWTIVRGLYGRRLSQPQLFPSGTQTFPVDSRTRR
jgi:hypothetical protein